MFGLIGSLEPAFTMRRIRISLWVFDIGFRRMNANLAPGWTAHMFVFSMLALAMIASFEVGMPMAWPLPVIGAIDLLATQYFVRRSLRQIRKLGLLGPTRARWWIEVAALDWTFCISTGLFAVTHVNPAAVLPGWQNALITVGLDCAEYLFFAFLVLTPVGFFVGLIQGKRIRGRSLELVNWFFWSIVVILASCLLVPEHRVMTKWVAPTLLVLSVIVLCGAGVVALKQRMGTR